MPEPLVIDDLFVILVEICGAPGFAFMCEYFLVDARAEFGEDGKLGDVGKLGLGRHACNIVVR
jgi:hypothetical protein